MALAFDCNKLISVTVIAITNLSARRCHTVTVGCGDSPGVLATAESVLDRPSLMMIYIHE